MSQLAQERRIAHSLQHADQWQMESKGGRNWLAKNNPFYQLSFQTLREDISKALVKGKQSLTTKLKQHEITISQAFQSAGSRSEVEAISHKVSDGVFKQAVTTNLAKTGDAYDYYFSNIADKQSDDNGKQEPVITLETCLFRSYQDENEMGEGANASFNDIYFPNTVEKIDPLTGTTARVSIDHPEHTGIEMPLYYTINTTQNNAIEEMIFAFRGNSAEEYLAKIGETLQHMDKTNLMSDVVISVAVPTDYNQESALASAILQQESLRKKTNIEELRLRALTFPISEAEITEKALEISNQQRMKAYQKYPNIESIPVSQQATIEEQMSTQKVIPSTRRGQSMELPDGGQKTENDTTTVVGLAQKGQAQVRFAYTKKEKVTQRKHVMIIGPTSAGAKGTVSTEDMLGSGKTPIDAVAIPLTDPSVVFVTPREKIPSFSEYLKALRQAQSGNLSADEYKRLRTLTKSAYKALASTWQKTFDKTSEAIASHVDQQAQSNAGININLGFPLPGLLVLGTSESLRDHYLRDSTVTIESLNAYDVHDLTYTDAVYKWSRRYTPDGLGDILTPLYEELYTRSESGDEFARTLLNLVNETNSLKKLRDKGNVTVEGFMILKEDFDATLESSVFTEDVITRLLTIDALKEVYHLKESAIPIDRIEAVDSSIECLASQFDAEEHMMIFQPKNPEPMSFTADEAAINKQQQRASDEVVKEIRQLKIGRANRNRLDTMRKMLAQKRKQDQERVAAGPLGSVRSRLIGFAESKMPKKLPNLTDFKGVYKDEQYLKAYDLYFARNALQGKFLQF